ncbi:DNA-binding transcriptional LysR family regulator [Shinella sp. BE166]|uniref:LysR substrate-binding domain-containing protein n=1 Tax=Shinella sp. BE166 TaxID=3373918 RepID=UPI003EB77F6A
MKDLDDLDTLHTGLPALPNPRHLRVMEAVAKHASVSRAAEDVGLSQPAVSQAISVLEERYGRPLFDRSRNGTFPTPAGDVLLKRVRRALAQIEAAIATLSRGQANPAVVRNITSTQIRCLMAIAGRNSFSQAARDIGVSIASLQRAARELEANVSVSLYTASKNGQQANGAGMELARRFALALREMDAAVDDIRFLDGVESGRVLVGTLPMSGAYLIGTTIAKLTNAVPDAQVYVTNAPYDMQIDSLRRGEIDLIFGVLRAGDTADELQTEMMFTDPYCLICRSGHPLTERSSVTADDLRVYNWVVPKAGSPRRSQFDWLLRKLGVTATLGIEASSLNTILAVLNSSDRLALVSRHEADTALMLKLVHVIDSPIPFASQEKGVTMRQGWVPTPVQTRFLNILRAEASNFSGSGNR